jgi:hypothetical protein
MASQCLPSAFQVALIQTASHWNNRLDSILQVLQVLQVPQVLQVSVVQVGGQANLQVPVVQVGGAPNLQADLQTDLEAVM